MVAVQPDEHAAAHAAISLLNVCRVYLSLDATFGNLSIPMMGESHDVACPQNRLMSYNLYSSLLQCPKIANIC